MTTRFFRVEEKITLSELGHNADVCSNAAFVFDDPLVIEPSDLLELRDGAVILHTIYGSTPIPGKWDR